MKKGLPTKMPLILKLTTDQRAVSGVSINLKCCFVIILQQSLSIIQTIQQTLSAGSVGVLDSLLSLDLVLITCGEETVKITAELQ